MSVLRCKGPARHLKWMAAAVMTAQGGLLSGCASEKASYVRGPADQQLAQVRKFEMEDDGQPVQPPPARAMRAEEDDPTQPWSPNYGGPAPIQPRPSAPAAMPRAPSPYVPAQVDAAAQATTTGSLTRLTDEEADLVIAQAINAHEMRRR